MVRVDQVARIALGFPQVWESTSYGHTAWFVGHQSTSRGKGTRHFAWLRPFSKADIRRFGDAPAPDGDILAVRLADLAEKEAVLSAHPDTYFTIPHFDGFAAVLIQLRKAARAEVAETLEDGWLACAPPSLVETYLAGRSG